MADKNANAPEEAKAQENVNTTKSVKNTKVTAGQLDKEIKAAARILGEQKEVSITIPGYLEKRLGKTVPVAVNGAVIHVPVGKKVKIPESMSKLLNDSLVELKL